MFRVGLTGGIASGKSAAAARFEALGITVIDTDQVARRVVEPGEPGLAEIVDEFGPDVLTAVGTLDRAAMRRRIFADAAAKQRLEAILHPRIRARTLADAAAADSAYVVIAVPLLVETGFSAHVHRVLVVDCQPALQVQRLIARDGVSETEARAALAAQVDRASRLAAADDVIDNSGSLDALIEQVDTLHATYLEMSRNCPESEGRAE